MSREGNSTGGDVPSSVESAITEHAGLVIASLVATFRDIDLAQDAFQEASVAAIERWPIDGIPRKPGAWLTTAARRRAIDALRRARTRSADRLAGHVAEHLYGDDEPDVGTILDAPIEDERLRLVFTCCHPALPVEARVALTLRLLGGLSTAQVARAFFVAEPTMAKRLVRAKKKIAEARIPYRVPEAEELPDRLPSVLLVLYLIFNQGWAAAEEGGALATDAIRLARSLDELLPREPEVAGLLALMLLSHARRDARLADGLWIPLPQQDVTRWHWPEIREGLAILTKALEARQPGTYQLQAAIAAKHAERADRGETPWAEIAALYETLESIDPRPVVRLNLAVARVPIDGARTVLDRLTSLEAEAAGDFDAYQPWHAARAAILADCGRREEAAAAYRQAIEGAPSDPERRFLEEELAALDAR